MATLTATTVTGTLTATTSFSSPTHITSFNNQRYREYRSGDVVITNGSYIDLFGNTGVHERMYGSLYWFANHGYFLHGLLYFQLSEYGLSTWISGITNDVYSVARHNPSYGTNYLRFTNTDGNGTQGSYQFTIRVSGMGGFSYTSSYITTQVR